MKIKMLASSCRESFNWEVSAVSITIRHSEILFTHTDQEMMNGRSFFFFKSLLKISHNLSKTGPIKH